MMQCAMLNNAFCLVLCVVKLFLGVVWLGVLGET
jgi:hypothetical protein